MIELINEILEKEDMKIFESYELKAEDDENISDIIVTENCILEYSNINMKLFIAFHAGTRADFASNITLQLSKISDLEIFIVDMFIYDEDSKDIKYGEEAISLYASYRNKKIISKFVDNQKRTNYLAKTTMGNC